MGYQFDAKLIAALRRAGWHAARNIESSQFASDWQKDGYKVFPEASMLDAERH
jgi:hypothetical protein